MTIDINELRRLAQAATPGPDGVSLKWVKLLQDFQKEATPAAISELLDRLEEAESDVLEQARLNGMGASREAALMAKLEAAEKERDALRTRIEAMEKQEPVARIIGNVTEWVSNGDGTYSLGGCVDAFAPLPDETRLYLAPGAQPAPSTPEGWKLVPIEPTEKMINDGSCASSLPGPHYISEDCAKQCWEYMLAATPEAKP